VWTGDIGDPALQSILQPLVSVATSKLSTAAGGADDVRLAEIRLSMMLAHPEGTEAPRLSLDDRNRAMLMENSRRLVSGPGTSGTMASLADTGASVRSVIDEAVGATIVPPTATAESEAAELASIQELAQNGSNGDPAPTPAQVVPKRSTNPFKA
jgi:hypothetical protein